jgi:hypothetical protein
MVRYGNVSDNGDSEVTVPIAEFRARACKR